MAVTMKDIARELGVSIITVSKALRGHSDIGPETKQKVLSLARELKYTPNLAARSLVTGRSHLVGLVVPNLLNPFFVEIANSLAKILKTSGYYLILLSSEEDPRIEQQAIEHLLAHRLDALVVSSCALTLPEVFKSIQGQKLPLVLLDRSFEGFKANFVGSDDVQIGYSGAKHLLELGRKKIAHIRGPENSIGQRRLAGFLKACQEWGRVPDEGYVIGTTTVDFDSTNQGFVAMQRMLASKLRPDAVFCYNDLMAIGAMRAITQAGLDIPGDIAVMGCGNLHYDVHLRVPLTSIDQQSEQLGERAANMLLAILNGKGKPEFRSAIEPSRLVIRESSQPV